MIQYFRKNTKGRDFFVGDLHGEITKFQTKLREVNFNGTVDRVFSVGDLVDRGEDSITCAYLTDQPWFHAVQGNHENMCIRYPLGNMDIENYSKNGGKWNIELGTEQSQVLANMLNELPLMLEIETDYGTVGVVHAEVAGGDWNWCKENIHKKSTQQNVMWNRDKITQADDSLVYGIDFVVVGHTPVQRPFKLGNVFYIGTGACFGRELTLIGLEQLIKAL